MKEILIPLTIPETSWTRSVAGRNAFVRAFGSLSMELMVELFPIPVLPNTRIENEKSNSG